VPYGAWPSPITAAQVARGRARLTFEHVAWLAGRRAAVPVQPIHEIHSRYYLRFDVLDKPGVLSQLSGILGKHEISISSVLQRGRKDGQVVPVVMTTHMAVERNMQAALKEIAAFPFVSGRTTVIRIEGEDR
jgi:homoserine dehydrogenase